ncbi:MAG: peptide chain release factor-like protein [Pirellulales bacterium]|nr:peptide chain release factor-like protein [Pirellulales bacterium]
MLRSHPAVLPEDEFLAACTIVRTRRSGPGGQHRNKVETAIIIEHRPTGIRAEANERRSQAENRGVALRRLRIRLAIQVRTPRHGIDTTRPSLLWQSRCQAGRIEVSPSHSDFPALLAEALDMLHACDHDLPMTAQKLGVSTSQYIRFLKREPAAFAEVNRIREQRGLHRLQ